jgi:hypothetical protein
MSFGDFTHPGSLEASACREAMDTVADLKLVPIQIAWYCLKVVNGLIGLCVGVPPER